jgi:hypothetical protein
MTARGLGALRAFAVAAPLLCAAVAWAHEFTLEALISAFFKVGQGEAHLVVRAPLYLFKEVRFPVKNIEIDVDHAGDAVQRALAALQRGIVVEENGIALPVLNASARLSLPSDRSFASYDEAVRHVATPVAADTRIVVDQGYVDAHFVYRTASTDGVFSLRTSAGAEIGTKLALRYIGAGGEERAVLVRSGSGAVELNPSVWGAARGFIGLGVQHIVTGVDHLLFLLCLIIPLRGVRQLLTIVTGFTVAHSFTLIGSAFGLAPQGAWFAPFVEMMIAISIVYMAIENIVGVSISRRVLLAMLFGLVHGFAFSQGLQDELQFAGAHLLAALFAFNIGIEAGQVMALALMLPLLALVVRHVLPGRVGSIILAALIAHVGWHWMTDRWDALTRARWPSLGLVDVVPLLLWGAGVVVLTIALRAVIARLRLEPVASPQARG